MREIRERVRRKRVEGLLPAPGELPTAVAASFPTPTAGRIASACAEIGRKPPAPDTLRGRIGALAIGFLQRLLFWYTFQLAKFGQAVHATFLDYAGALQHLEALAEASRAEFVKFNDRISALATAQEQTQYRLAEAERRAAAAEQQLHERGHEIQSALRRILEAKAAGGEERCGRPNPFGIWHDHAERGLPPFDEEQLQTMADEARARVEALYCNFEDAFRGSREDIRERLRVYLPCVREVVSGQAEAAVLDVGCGRGEWLELLRDEGIRARGIDSNATVVTRCRGLGLDVEVGDCLRYFAATPDASLDVVTAFQLVEHLPWELFLTLLDEIARVLRPGGAFIVETPNPENVLVGANSFYADPTHVKPTPASTTRFMMEARGFCRVEVLFLNPYPEAMRVEGDSELCRRFNQFFYGAQDYAVIGHKA